MGNSSRALSCALAFVAACGACATASPVLAPARVLRAGRLSLDVGAAYQAPVAPAVFADARDADARLAAGSNADADRETVLRSALAGMATPPGVAPYVAGRIGLGAGAEGALALVGRVVRAGARRAFVTSGAWTLSAGIDGRFALLDGAADGTVPGLSVSDGRAYGGDATMVVGFTRRNIYDFWLGLRAGALFGSATAAQAHVSPSPFDVTLGRVETGATFGTRIGFGHVAAAIELSVEYAWTWGSALGRDVHGGGMALVPASAISYVF